MNKAGEVILACDGMNLAAKEYVACQIENKGVLILSEMAGVAAELNEALMINSSDNIEMVEAIFKALEMKESEINSRLKRMQTRISNYNVFTWAYDFFKQTFDTKERQKRMNVKYVNKTISSLTAYDYQDDKHRTLSLDYDTLVSFAKYRGLAVIDKKTLKIIRNLSSDPRNQIVIISGRSKDFLTAQFRGVGVALVAEHGYYVDRVGEKWEATINSNLEWKESVMPTPIEHVSCCNGTFIEEKVGSIVWHFRNADSDFAQLRLHGLRDDFAEIIRHKTDFEILEGNKVLEIKSDKYDKGQAANTLINGKQYGFVLAAGDDKTDEFLFKSLPNSLHTIRVGLSPPFAKYNATGFHTYINC